MPELPEVETIVRGLRSEIINKKFWSVEGKLKSILYPSFREFESKLPGLRILDVRRRGKFIVFVLSNKMRLVIHLRMTGRLMWHKEKGREKYIRAVFNFSDATALFYSDVRKFGRIWLYNEKDYERASGIYKLGQEPLATNLSFEKFYKLFDGKSGILKNNLLRQDLVAGIGNIYADEICFRSGFLPTTRLNNIGKKGYQNIYGALRYCLKEGIKHRGVSVSDFVSTRGNLGKHQHYLKVYGRAGDKCYVCKSIIEKTRAAGRGTYYCAVCQK